jgi:uncharacterized protein
VAKLNKLFQRKPDNFLKLLCEQAEFTLQGLEQLELYMQNQDIAAAKGVTSAEKEADEVRRILIDDLNRTFVTPIDREDIFALSRAIDDVLDYAYSTVDEMDILEVKSTPNLYRISSLLKDSGKELLMAVRRLSDHPGVAAEHAKRAKALENQVENLYREAIAELFKGPEECKYIIEMLKLREVYRHLSNAADRGDEAANIIADIVVKMA